MQERPYRLDLKIDYLPPMNTAATRRHHQQVGRHAKQARMLMVGLVGSERKPKKPLARARIRCERHSGSRQPDDENLRMSFKPFIDALTKSQWRKNKNTPGGRRWIQRADVLKDDSPEILEREYAWHPAPPKKGFIRIVVEEIET